MIHVKIGELRNRLSALLSKVRAGEQIVVYDRDTPVARIEPIPEKPRQFKNDQEKIAWLVATGKLLPPKNPNPDWRWLWTVPRSEVQTSVVEALLEERREDER